MPLPERLIVPVNVSRGTLQYPVPDELEGVTNGTLANIIRQLSSLSRHAEEMFGNLFNEAEVIANRSSNLQARIDKLAVRVTQLDSAVEEGECGKRLVAKSPLMKRPICLFQSNCKISTSRGPSSRRPPSISRSFRGPQCRKQCKNSTRPAIDLRPSTNSIHTGQKR